MFMTYEDRHLQSSILVAYEARRANLIEGLTMQVRLRNWVKVAALAGDLRVLEAEHAKELTSEAA